MTIIWWLKMPRFYAPFHNAVSGPLHWSRMGWIHFSWFVIILHWLFKIAFHLMFLFHVGVKLLKSDQLKFPVFREFQEFPFACFPSLFRLFLKHRFTPQFHKIWISLPEGLAIKTHIMSPINPHLLCTQSLFRFIINTHSGCWLRVVQ